MSEARNAQAIPNTLTYVGGSDGTNARPLKVNAAGEIVTADATTGVADNRKVVTTAGTAVALAASTPARWVIVTAETDNTGVMAVGGSTVVAALATRRGTPLFAGDSVTVVTDNLIDVFIDSTVNGDGVTFTHGT